VTVVRRLFWVALGATVGVLVVRKVTRTAEAVSPAGLARALEGAGDGLRDFAASVRAGMADREEELRVALGVDAGTMDPEEARSLIEHPTGRRARH
jgi:Family of unknown function (DUF6167)